jgi:prolipoprotein diacylglyceryl transferase
VYGIIISLSVLISSLVAERIAKKRGKDPSVLWEGLFWTVLLGIVGARLYHVIDYWTYYAEDFFRMLMVWRGGLGIIGGIVAGAIASAVYLKRKNESIPEWFDIAGTVMPLGQFIGRFGNIWNRELLPFAYYEMGADLILFFVLLMLQKKIQKKGVVFLLYLIGYVLVRLILQPLRSINNL